jgi:23S rRNA G2445 N2-methylase RlmL
MTRDVQPETDADARPFFATAAKGAEGALRDELRELRLPKVRAARGGVHFGGELEHAMRACLRSRIASRVLWRVAEFGAPDPDALYDGARAVDWARWLDARRTLAVSATVKNGQLRHSGYVAQRIKDGVVDLLRDRDGRRPDVDTRDPDVHIVAHIDRDQAQVFVDLAGAPLSRRGYRTEAGEAPLRENLAAAIVRLAGYEPGRPLLDPMCGSGTLPIEAAMWAQALPPGARRRFGFERWRCFDDAALAAWELELQRAKDFARPVSSRIEGSDRDPRVLDVARANARRAGVSVAFRRAALDALEVPEPGTLVVINPPYGVRLAREERWVSDLGRALERMCDCTVVAITPDRTLPRELGCRPHREHTLFNGNLECRLFTWLPA